MKTTKPRNREHRTKSAQQGNLITIHVHLPRDAYDQMRDMERRKLYTKDEISFTSISGTYC